MILVVFVFLVVILVTVNGFIVMTTLKVARNETQVEMEIFFLKLTIDLVHVKKDQHIALSDFLSTKIANPYNAAITVQQPFLLDSSSKFYVISEATAAQLDLVMVGECIGEKFGTTEFEASLPMKTIVRVMMNAQAFDVVACVYPDLNIVSKLLLEKLTLLNITCVDTNQGQRVESGTRRSTAST